MSAPDTAELRRELRGILDRVRMSDLTEREVTALLVIFAPIGERVERDGLVDRSRQSPRRGLRVV
ncbi:hypothetical protein [Gordonia sp. ABSL49_1]|uniref:hypothetical protein n=1 Tax=Gordonia sp. ABSL49_1 TaxID=2920941 RepID=UPI001F1012E1|nr:hypothetical protein [Gordonia sp. ABSL49_1]MCH5645700.1 hypothetical protein [Gordonia sp. ABSL49_1]